MKFCAALMPTRNAVRNVQRSLRSFFGTANTPNDMEAVLRIDDDNRIMIEALPAMLREFPNLSWVIGPRYAGYTSMGTFIEEATNAANSRWVFMLDDDAEMIGKGWDTQLYEMGSGKEELDFGAQAEHYMINNSCYNRIDGKPCTPVGLFVPRHFEKRWGIEHICSPADQCWQDILTQHNMPIRQLNGITYLHHHDLNSHHRKAGYVPGT